MKAQPKKRGLFAGVGAVVTALALTFTAASVAQADTVAPGTPPSSSDVVITKLEQPDLLTSPADGTPVENPGTAIPNVTFEAYLVEGTAAGQPNDIGTNAGQQWVAGLSGVTDEDVTLASSPAYTGTTNGSGVIEWGDVTRGLYVVTEVKNANTPVGLTRSPDFFLSVPMTDPSSGAGWLDTIYVYPKNSVVTGSKTVAEGSSYVVGDNVTWTIAADVPRVQGTGSDVFVAPSGYKITDTLNDDQLELDGAPVVRLGDTTLTDGVEYNYTTSAASGTTTHEITFTPAGRQALADAVNDDASVQVTVELVTTVLSAEEITNGANVYPNQESITDETPLVIEPTTAIKFGGYQINKVSNDSSVEDLSGAEFRVYLTREAADAAGDDYLTPSTNTSGLWTTNADGQVHIDGLRYTGWVNGEAVSAGQTGYQTYWLVETKALEGHQLLGEPVEFVVNDSSATQVAQQITNVTTSAGGFELPLTGGTGTLMLTLGGLVLLALVLLVVARRRRALASAE